MQRHSQPFNCSSRQAKVKPSLKTKRLPRFLQNLAMTNPIVSLSLTGNLINWKRQFDISKITQIIELMCFLVLLSFLRRQESINMMSLDSCLRRNDILFLLQNSKITNNQKYLYQTQVRTKTNKMSHQVRHDEIKNHYSESTCPSGGQSEAISLN